MARLSFKPDASFFRKIAIGAVGTRAIAADLANYGHQVVELERGATDTKLWKDVKRKRVRIPDLVCQQCGRRIESRAKTQAELAMSHSLVEARAWDFGMVDPDWIAFPVCEPADEDPWSVGRLRAGGSYWHEREWVRWRTGGRINYFTVAAFRAVPYSKSSTKGVTEGSETTVAWNATFANYSGVVETIEGRKLLIRPASGGARRSRKIPNGQEILIAAGDAVETHQVLGSVVAALTAPELTCPGVLPEGHIAHLLSSRERTQRFTGIKLARLRGEPEHRSAAEELASDDEEDVYVRLEAASYLVSTCGQSPRTLFGPYLGSTDPQNTLEAVIALAEAATPEAVERLSELLDDGDQPHYLRSAAAWGLGRIGGEAAISRLMRAFADVNQAIREEALEHLATLGAAATPILLEGLRAPSPDIAAGAAEALRQQQPRLETRSRAWSTSFVRPPLPPGRSGCTATCPATRSPGPSPICSRPPLPCTTPSACSGRTWKAGSLATGSSLPMAYPRGSGPIMPFELPRETLVYATPLGLQACADSRVLLDALPRESVDLILTSPPFALLRQKRYGNEDQADYVAWLVAFGRAALRVLKPSGSFVMDLGGAYQRGRPVRSLYNFRVLLEFCDDVGYHLAEEFFWYNPAKLPSPIEWVNKRKIRAKDAVNTVWWFSKTESPKADVTRVLAPYSERMKTLLKDPEAFYTPKERPSGHDIASAFAKDNGGAIPSNLLQIPNTESNSHYLRTCRFLGREGHPARFPGELPRFFIKFLTDPGDIIVDIFSGSNTTGDVAETLGRRWLSIEIDRAYAALSAIRLMEGWDETLIRSTLQRIEDQEFVTIHPKARSAISLDEANLGPACSMKAPEVQQSFL